MTEKRKSLEMSEALSMLMAHRGSEKKDYVSIEQSNSHFLAEDLIADYDVPPFNRSPYDGFAIRAYDTKQATTHAPAVFQIIGTIGAGEVFKGRPGASQTVRIMTGAKIPDGCDAVIMKEAVKEVTVEGKPYIHVRRPLQPNTNISFAGEDIEKGTVLAKKGKYIHPGVVALLATFGYERVPICSKPRVGVIATGSELLDIDEPLQPGKIRNSNGYMLSSQITRAGGEAVYFGGFKDEFTAGLRMVQSSLEQVDLLITTGGASVGDYDYMPRILKEMGAHILFNKVSMRPGSVTTVAEKNNKLIFALSGNPSACYVGFELFARPIIRSFLSASYPFTKKTVAILGADFPKRNPFDRFVRGKLTYENGRLIATPTGLDKSGVISSLAEANTLIVFPGGTSDYKKGMGVPVILLDDQEGSSFEDFVLDS